MIIPQSAIDDLAVESPITDAATVGLHTARKVVNTAGTVGKAALMVKGTIGKSSISRMADDSILKFPTVFSASIDTDEAIPIAKTLEKHYAAMLVSIFSLRPSVSLNEYDNIAEYIKSVHTNKGIPTNLKKAQHFARESFIGEEEDDEEFCLVNDEPSGLCVNAEFIENYPDATKLAVESWGIYGGQLNDTVLNELVQPYRRTQTTLEDRLNEAKAAKEVLATESYLDKIQSSANAVVNVGRNADNSLMSDAGSRTGVAAVGKNEIKSIQSNQKLSALEPTMINVSFYLHGSKSGGAGTGASFVQNVVLGVKTMIRSVSSEYMTTNLVEGSKTSNPIFKLIAWTRGEYKLVKDLVFNIGETKKKFKDKKNDEYGFLDMSKNRKEVDDVAKYAGNRVLPYLSLIVTDYEVAQASQITGVDLSNFRNAKNFMDKYYLLAFGIYNPNTKVLDILFDGDTDWDSMSMTFMTTQAKANTDVNKLLGNLSSSNR